MKNVVSIVATFALLALLSVSSAFGQMTPPEEGAVMIGTFRVQAGIAKSGPDLTYSVAEEGEGAVSIVAWLTSSGSKTVYTIDVNTAEFYAPCGWAKQMELSAMMDMFAQAAVRKGVELGYSHAGGDCLNNIVDVYYPACVAREIGPDCPKLISAPGTPYNINGYSVCGPNYNPTIALVYTICAGAECGGMFQSTCMTAPTQGTATPGVLPVKVSTAAASVKLG